MEIVITVFLSLIWVRLVSGSFRIFKREEFLGMFNGEFELYFGIFDSETNSSVVYLKYFDSNLRPVLSKLQVEVYDYSYVMGIINYEVEKVILRDKNGILFPAEFLQCPENLKTAIEKILDGFDISPSPYFHYSHQKTYKGSMDYVA